MYELKSYKKPLIKGHQPIPLEIDALPVEDNNAIKEAIRLFSNKDCWHITINEYATDVDKTLRGTPHWCADVEQVQTYLKEMEY